MMTFVVRFLADPATKFHGKVRHVGTGEETLFTSVMELLTFFEGMATVGDVASRDDDEALIE